MGNTTLLMAGILTTLGVAILIVTIVAVSSSERDSNASTTKSGSSTGPFKTMATTSVQNLTIAVTTTTGAEAAAAATATTTSITTTTTTTTTTTSTMTTTTTATVSTTNSEIAPLATDTAHSSASQQCYEIKDWIAAATGSSVYLNEEQYGGHLVVDGLISEEYVGYFHSNADLYAWLQLDFSTPMTIESLSVSMRVDCCVDYRFKNIGIYVGNDPASYGAVSRNQKCTYYEGPAQNGEIVELTCNALTSGQFVVIQIIHWNYEPLMVNEVSVCGYLATPELIIPGPLQPDEWIILEQHGIQAWFSQESMFFDDALSFCNSMDSSLFEPYNHEILEAFTDAARRAGMHRIWLGLTDLVEAGVFTYSTNGEVAAFFNWAENQPDNYGDEDCVDVQVAYGKMNDVPADTEGRNPACVKAV